ncbi:MAG: hypothetical protein AAGA96_05615 [Verrucomicrobiota bacterium]
MSRLFPLLSLSLLASFPPLAGASAPESEAAQTVEELKSMLHWHHSYEEALAEAKETGKPLFVEFRCAP